MEPPWIFKSLLHLKLKLKHIKTIQHSLKFLPQSFLKALTQDNHILFFLQTAYQNYKNRKIISLAKVINRIYQYRKKTNNQEHLDVNQEILILSLKSLFKTKQNCSLIQIWINTVLCENYLKISAFN